MAIDIGSPAIDRVSRLVAGRTRICKENPADKAGKITVIEIFASYLLEGMTGCEVATFYRPDPTGCPNKFTTRDTYPIGAVPIGYSTRAVDLNVEVGDYIGIYYTAGKIDYYASGGQGIWYINGDNIPCADITFSFADGAIISLYGTGVVSIPVVTTQAESEKGIDHAKGNGTIVSGDEITGRGFEVRTVFSGTLYEYIEHSIAGFVGTVSLSAAHKWEGVLTKTVVESGTFAIESFTGDLGRFPVAVFSDKLFALEHYSYRARATNGTGTGYGAWVAFTTNGYPSGQLPDDQIPIEDIIPSEPPVEPVEPWEPPFEPVAPIEPIEPFIPPGITWPDFPYPDIPPWNGSWLGWFYYRKAYTKKDLDDLRRKCRIFQDNSVEYALVVNHNSRVLQQFLNNMTEYMSKDEHNTFRPIIPTQHLNTLARRPLDVLDFKEIINNFINNSIDNANNVNNNFRLIRDGLSDYTYTEDEGFVDISITTRLVNDNNPDVDRLKKVVDRLNKEMANNYAVINHNLHVLRAILI